MLKFVELFIMAADCFLASSQTQAEMDFAFPGLSGGKRDQSSVDASGLQVDGIGRASRPRPSRSLPGFTNGFGRSRQAEKSQSPVSSPGSSSG